VFVSLIFTESHTWTGGSFDILFHLDSSSEERLKKFIRRLWSYPSLTGVWFSNSEEPLRANQKNVNNDQEEFPSILYGIALVDEVQLACCTHHLRDDDGDWVYFGVPLGSLSRLYPVNAFPWVNLTKHFLG
jgi:hypothetical protein